MKISFRITLDAEMVIKRIKNFRRKYPGMVMQAQQYVASEHLFDCRKYVPILTGALRDSGHIEEDIRRLVVYIVWNAANPQNNFIYAHKQHEEILRHIDGTYKAEWVERAIRENPLKYTFLIALIMRRLFNVR